ncbi:MAG: Clp protease ClpP [Clostridiales bacterium]|nr:Clp protease ClpP [Roseburia sp.]MDD7635310.1 Clp protease ClpP [Clostridiales bacterium]MDY4113978.1 Clp protease ClpP [Roseburia sp.]
MKQVKISGVIVPNEDKWIYDWFGMEATCPDDVKKAIKSAGKDEITFVINSPGGEIGAGSEMWYMINSYEQKTYADIVGYACSAASYLAMGADVVRMAPTALMMIHLVSGDASGNCNAMEKEASTLRVADKAISNAYKLKTGKSNEELLALMEQETWMDAEKAKELGFIDSIIGAENEAKAMPIYNAFGNILSEEVKEKVRNMVKHTDTGDSGNQDFLLQTKLNLLKLGGMRNV